MLLKAKEVFCLIFLSELRQNWHPVQTKLASCPELWLNVARLKHPGCWGDALCRWDTLSSLARVASQGPKDTSTLPVCSRFPKVSAHNAQEPQDQHHQLHMRQIFPKEL